MTPFDFVLHGDIKPANVFLERDDMALLGDLGVALEMDAYGRADAIGDLLVQPPEAFTRMADVRSDVYGVGVTMYRLLTGRWPYEDSEPGRLRRLIADARLTRVRDIAPHVSRAFALLVERALNPNQSGASAMLKSCTHGLPG